MTISLTHLADLQRVRVDVSDRPDGSVLVERSRTAAFLISSVVRGAIELPIVGGTGQVDDYDGWVSDVANHYRVSPVDPPAGLLLADQVGDYASTPDTAALDITGDLDLRTEAVADDWTVFTTRTLSGKYNTTGNQRSWRITMIPDGIIRFQFSTDGSSFNNRDSTVPVPVESGAIAVRVTVDVDNGAAGHTVTFYTSTSGVDGSWTQLGAPVVTAGTISFFSGSAPLEAGASNDGQSNVFFGTIRAVQVRSGIDGTIVANPDFAAQPHGTTGFTDSAGRTWTVNGTAQIVGIEQDSITPSLEGEVWLKSIQYPAFNHPVIVQTWAATSRRSRSGLAEVSGRTHPTGLGEQRGPRQFELTVAVGPPFDQSLDAISEAGDEDLRLTVGDWFFIHVPLGRGVPGGYVMIGDTVEDRHPRAGDDAPRVFTLPCTAVNPPGPDVVGGTITLGGLINLTGSIEQAAATWPTIRDALETFGSLDDLVVL